MKKNWNTGYNVLFFDDSDFWEALRFSSERVYLFFCQQKPGKIIFLILLLALSVSPALVDAAITAQYLGYDTVIMLIEVQLSAIFLFIISKFLVPINLVMQKLIVIKRKNTK